MCGIPDAPSPDSTRMSERSRPSSFSLSTISLATLSSQVPFPMISNCSSVSCDSIRNTSHYYASLKLLQPNRSDLFSSEHVMQAYKGVIFDLDGTLVEFKF